MVRDEVTNFAYLMIEPREIILTTEDFLLALFVQLDGAAIGENIVFQLTVIGGDEEYEYAANEDIYVPLFDDDANDAEWYTDRADYAEAEKNDGIYSENEGIVEGKADENV